MSDEYALKREVERLILEVEKLKRQIKEVNRDPENSNTLLILQLLTWIALVKV
jgi:hypothetical protein